jgi:hypothetical protein
MSQRGRPFEPGNTIGRGRPPGSRNKTTQKAREVLESHSETLIRKMIVLAMQGDTKMLIALMGPILGKTGAASVKIGGVKFKTLEDLSKSSEAVLKKVASGKLPPDHAQQFLGFIDQRRQVIETRELEPRVRELESKP